MKKILTSLFALAAVFCASAEVPTYSVSPADGSTIENRENLTVTFTFSEAVKADSVQFASGPRFNRYMTEAALSMTAPSTTISVQVPATAWGEVVGSEYLLTVTLTNMSYSDGTPITIEDESETGEVTYLDFKAAASYSSPDTTPASYLRYEPASDEVTAWEAYNDGWGVIDFIFSGEVEMTNTNRTARVRYTLTSGEYLTTDIPADEIWADWNFWTGEYNLSVMLPFEESLTYANLEAIRVTLYGITSNGVAITTEVANYYKGNVQPSINTRSNNTAGISSLSSSEYVTVYNIQGSVIAKNILVESLKDLPSGIYIVNGKKIIIK